MRHTHTHAHTCSGVHEKIREKDRGRGPIVGEKERENKKEEGSRRR